MTKHIAHCFVSQTLSAINASDYRTALIHIAKQHSPFHNYLEIVSRLDSVEKYAQIVALYELSNQKLIPQKINSQNQTRQENERNEIVANILSLVSKAYAYTHNSAKSLDILHTLRAMLAHNPSGLKTPYSLLVITFAVLNQWKLATQLLRELDSISSNQAHDALYVYTYNCVVSTLARHGKWEIVFSLLVKLRRNRRKSIGRHDEALELLHALKREGIPITLTCYVSVLDACAADGQYETCIDVFNDMINSRVAPDIRVFHSILHALCVYSSPEPTSVICTEEAVEASVDPPKREVTNVSVAKANVVLLILENMEKEYNVIPDRKCYQKAIQCLVARGEFEEAMDLFTVMETKEMTLEMAFLSEMCVEFIRLNEKKLFYFVFEKISSFGDVSDEKFECLIAFLARENDFENALRIFEVSSLQRKVFMKKSVLSYLFSAFSKDEQIKTLVKALNTALERTCSTSTMKTNAYRNVLDACKKVSSDSLILTLFHEIAFYEEEHIEIVYRLCFSLRKYALLVEISEFVLAKRLNVTEYSHTLTLVSLLFLNKSERILQLFSRLKAHKTRLSKAAVYCVLYAGVTTGGSVSGLIRELKRCNGYRVLDSMTALLRVCAATGTWRLAVYHAYRLVSRGFRRTIWFEYCVCAVLRIHRLDIALYLYRDCAVLGMKPSTRLCRVLLKAVASQRHWKAFDEISADLLYRKPDSETVEFLAQCYSLGKRWRRALILLLRLKRLGCRISKPTLSAVLLGYRDSGEWGVAYDRLLRSLRRLCPESTLELYSVLITLQCRRKEYSTVVRFFVSLCTVTKPNLDCYACVMKALANLGNYDQMYKVMDLVLSMQAVPEMEAYKVCIRYLYFRKEHKRICDVYRFLGEQNVSLDYELVLLLLRTVSQLKQWKLLEKLLEKYGMHFDSAYCKLVLTMYARRISDTRRSEELNERTVNSFYSLYAVIKERRLRVDQMFCCVIMQTLLRLGDLREFVATFNDYITRSNGEFMSFYMKSPPVRLFLQVCLRDKCWESVVLFFEKLERDLPGYDNNYTFQLLNVVATAYRELGDEENATRVTSLANALGFKICV